MKQNEKIWHNCKFNWKPLIFWARFADVLHKQKLGFGVKKSSISINKDIAVTRLHVRGGISEIFVTDPVVIFYTEKQHITFFAIDIIMN